MRKRLVSAALAAAMALSMTACTSNPAEKETEAAAPADTEAAEEGGSRRKHRQTPERDRYTGRVR